VNDIQRGLDYENISYTKEQNEKMLNEIETAQMNEQTARSKADSLKIDLKIAAHSKCIKITNLKTVDMNRFSYSRHTDHGEKYEFFTEADFLKEHTDTLKKNEELNQSLAKLESINRALISRDNIRTTVIWLAVGSFISATLWIFF